MQKITFALGSHPPFCWLLKRTLEGRPHWSSLRNQSRSSLSTRPCSWQSWFNIEAKILIFKLCQTRNLLTQPMLHIKKNQQEHICRFDGRINFIFLNLNQVASPLGALVQRWGPSPWHPLLLQALLLRDIRLLLQPGRCCGRCRGPWYCNKCCYGRGAAAGAPMAGAFLRELLRLGTLLRALPRAMALL